MEWEGSVTSLERIRGLVPLKTCGKASGVSSRVDFSEEGM
jgi:hypothetical protein